MAKTTTPTPQRTAYNEMRARAVDGEYVDEDELIQALADAIASEERQAILDAIDAERAAHKADEAAQVKEKRKAAEGKLAELVTTLVEAREITAQAHTDMRNAITEYDRAVNAQNAALYTLRDALTEAGYPTVQPRTGVESAYVDPERHPNGGGWVVFDGETFMKAEESRSAIPRFHTGLEAA